MPFAQALIESKVNKARLFLALITLSIESIDILFPKIFLLNLK